MRIGVLGAGMIGATVGRLWVNAGHEVRFATRHPEQIAQFVQSLGPRASSGSPTEAVSFGSVVLLAVPFLAVPALGRDLGGEAKGKIILDATNPYPQRDGDAVYSARAHGKGSSAWVATHFPGAHVVKAFNTVFFKVLEKEAHRGDDRVAIPLAADDAASLETAAQLVREAGFEPIPAGSLEEGAQFDPGSPFFNNGMRASELKRALAALNRA